MGATAALASIPSLREIHISLPPGFSEPEIERDLLVQHDIVQRWSRIGSIERVAFSAWLRWHRNQSAPSSLPSSALPHSPSGLASMQKPEHPLGQGQQGEWTPCVIAKDVADVKMKRWKRRKVPIMDWENRLGDALGVKLNNDHCEVQRGGLPPSALHLSHVVQHHLPSRMDAMP